MYFVTELHLFALKISPTILHLQIFYQISRVIMFFLCKSTSSFLIVRPNGRENSNKITEYINTTDSEFHSFCPPSNRPFRAVIGNLHHSIVSVDITNALNDLNHSVRRIENIKKQITIILMERNRSSNNVAIFIISSLLQTIVSIEKPHLKKKKLRTISMS